MFPGTSSSLSLGHPRNAQLLNWWYAPPGAAGTTKFADLTLNAQHASVYAGRWQPTNAGDFGLKFTASTDRAVAAHDGPTLFTVAASFYYDTASFSATAEKVFSTANAGGTSGFWLTHSSSGGGRLAFGNGTTTTLATGATLSVRTWYRFYVTWDGTTVRVYRDAVPGTYATSVPTGSIVYPSGFPFQIGNEQGSNLGWPGRVADVAFWGRALTDAQRLEDYRLKFAGYPGVFGQVERVLPAPAAPTPAAWCDNFFPDTLRQHRTQLVAY